MDALETLLADTRARGAVFCQSLVDPPWGLRFADGNALTVVAMARGTGWVLTDGEPVRLEAGDVAIVRGPDPYVVANAPGTDPRIVVESSEICTDATGGELPDMLYMGPRVWGERPDAADVLLTGGYQLREDVCQRLLDALPRVLVVPAETCGAPVMALVLHEVGADRPGQQAVLDRLLDLLLVSTLRAWFDAAGENAPGWYRALGDPVAGVALRLMHDEPARPWTVAGLAARAGVSRAGFARRFAEVVGEPPMAYLTGLRVSLAADRLRRSDDTVGAIARRVGYSDGYALSVAFTRLRGVRPGEFRVGA
ncbi:AraC family transcriptional regulator [Phytomonospora endophytica]|uniref:AraC-like DNA-binding protein n=1 Tax=Phytomonospora endophytica TaxID=714109 RepID=A0A841FZS6_9ACTN|nr:AraC family transcriptional regulator [Phytomonospora endophytica]MBB6038897.1 AraC-like DNA-binding protein [Phytomonospora endophytica]GIG71561.1 AraC family transcriptional regulator [Phytomonospora endophytica]